MNMQIYSLIPKTRYITREELCRLTGMSDRAIRDEINILHKNPATIVISSSHRKGYKRPQNIEELEMCLNESKSRVKDECEKQRILEKAIQKMRYDQGTLQFYLDFSA